MTGIFDVGLQPERTLLAWRRTCLAFAVASLVSVRFAFELLGGVSIVFAAGGLALAVAAYAGAGLRYRRATADLLEGGAVRASALPLLAITAAAALVGAACVLFIVLRSAT